MATLRLQCPSFQDYSSNTHSCVDENPENALGYFPEDPNQDSIMADPRQKSNDFQPWSEEPKAAVDITDNMPIDGEQDPPLPALPLYYFLMILGVTCVALWVFSREESTRGWNPIISASLMLYLFNAKHTLAAIVVGCQVLMPALAI